MLPRSTLPVHVSHAFVLHRCIPINHSTLLLNRSLLLKPYRPLLLLLLLLLLLRLNRLHLHNPQSLLEKEPALIRHGSSVIRQQTQPIHREPQRYLLRHLWADPLRWVVIPAYEANVQAHLTSLDDPDSYVVEVSGRSGSSSVAGGSGGDVVRAEDAITCFFSSCSVGRGDLVEMGGCSGLDGSCCVADDWSS